MQSLIELAAERFPNHLAFDDGERPLTYAELKELVTARSIANRAEFETGDQVAWCPSNDVDAFIAFWSIQQRGLVACPISHRIPPEKRQQVLQRLDATWLDPVEYDTESTVRQSDADELGNPINAKLPAECSDDPLDHDWDRPATIILTSGSTGVPKAVVHSLAAHVASAKGAESVIPLQPGDRWLWSLPLCHVSGLSILIRCAVAGATVVGLNHGSALSHDLVRALRISHLSVVSTQLRRLLSDDAFPPSSLKSVLLGGASVDPGLVRLARERGVSLHTTYGLTEMASQVTTSTSTADPHTSGSTLPGRDVELSKDHEILVRGDTLCLGYYRSGNIERVTDEQGWFHTRDLGQWTADGQLIVRGRIDNLFISGGENIHPENIERAMVEAFAVEQVIVVPKSCETYGERPVAFVLGELPNDWREQLRQTLSGFEIPSEVLDWPSELAGDIKPNRNALQRRVRENT